MKKVSSLVLILALVVSFSSLTLAKSKHDHSHSPTVSVDVDFLQKSYGLDSAKVKYFSKYNFSSEELSMVLYLYSASGRAVSDGELEFIAKNKGNWTQIAWYFGMPPIIMKDSIVTFRHPIRVRHLPPLGNTEYKYEQKGEIEEKVEIKKDKYEYTYKNKALGIEEKLEITSDKYSYQYKDKNCEEKLEIKYPSYAYEYKYKDRNSGKEIKNEGTGKPLTPTYFYQQLKTQRTAEPEFRFSIIINLKL